MIACCHSRAHLQVLIRRKADLAAALACISERFPAAARVELYTPWQDSAADEQFRASLEALPGGCWPAPEEVCYKPHTYRKLPLCAAAQVARLCPQLRRIAFEGGSCTSGAQLAVAFESLAAVAGTLKALEFEVDLRHISGDPGIAARVVAALARLSSLQRLRFEWSSITGPFEAAAVLAEALPALQALTSLSLQGRMTTAPPPPLLAAWPEALRELDLNCLSGSWPADIMAAVPQLRGVTKLALQW